MNVLSNAYNSGIGTKLTFSVGCVASDLDGINPEGLDFYFTSTVYPDGTSGSSCCAFDALTPEQDCKFYPYDTSESTGWHGYALLNDACARSPYVPDLDRKLRIPPKHDCYDGSFIDALVCPAKEWYTDYVSNPTKSLTCVDDYVTTPPENCYQHYLNKFPEIGQAVANSSVAVIEQSFLGFCASSVIVGTACVAAGAVIGTVAGSVIKSFFDKAATPPVTRSKVSITKPDGVKVEATADVELPPQVRFNATHNYMADNYGRSDVVTQIVSDLGSHDKDCPDSHLCLYDVKDINGKREFVKYDSAKSPGTFSVISPNELVDKLSSVDTTQLQNEMSQVDLSPYVDPLQVPEFTSKLDALKSDLETMAAAVKSGASSASVNLSGVSEAVFKSDGKTPVDLGKTTSDSPFSYKDKPKTTVDLSKSNTAGSTTGTTTPIDTTGVTKVDITKSVPVDLSKSTIDSLSTAMKEASKESPCCNQQSTCPTCTNQDDGVVAVAPAEVVDDTDSYFSFIDELKVNPFSYQLSDFIPQMPKPATCDFKMDFDFPMFNYKQSFEPCDDFKPFREIMGWVFGGLTVFSCISIAFKSES